MPYNLGSWQRELDIPLTAYRRWNEFDLRGALEAETGLDVFCENDGTAAAVAELFQGHDRSLDEFLYVFIGAAVGGGVLLAGDYRRGVHANAGDLGLMPTTPSRLATAPRPERRPEILLTRASVNALIRHLRGSGLRVETREELDSLLERRSSRGRRLVGGRRGRAGPAGAVGHQGARCAGRGASTVPCRGRFSTELIHLLDGMLATASPESREPPRLLRGSVGRDAPAIGAAILPLHLNYSSNTDVLVP